MRKYVGTIGHTSVAMAAAMSIILGMKHAKSRPRPPPTPEQIAAADKRTEREKWNEEVAQRKADKLAKKAAP